MQEQHIHPNNSMCYLISKLVFKSLWSEQHSVHSGKISLQFKSHNLWVILIISY